MKASVFYKHGPPDVLEFDDVDDPVVSNNDVLVKVKACSINHLDLWIRRGKTGYSDIPFPHILGCDISGTIEDSNGFSDINDGDEVIVSPGVSCGKCNHCLQGNDNFCKKFSIIGGWDRKGGYAEFASVPSQNLIPKPKNLSFEESASLPLTFLTAWNMLVKRAQIKTGEKVLIVGGSSGVGSAAIQIAKLFNCYVFATAGTEDKLNKMKNLGADFVINHTSDDFGEIIRENTARNGVNVVFEHVGAATWSKSIDSLTHGGRLITCGTTTGSETDFDIRLLYRRQLSLMGSFMGSKGDLLHLLKFIDSGKLKPVLGNTFPLKDASKAHELIENRQHFGKVVLKV